jgi:hypothetical protein
MYRMYGMPRAQDAQERRVSGLHHASMYGMPRAQDAHDYHAVYDRTWTGLTYYEIR